MMSFFSITSIQKIHYYTQNKVDKSIRLNNYAKPYTLANIKQVGPSLFTCELCHIKTQSAYAKLYYN